MTITKENNWGGVRPGQGRKLGYRKDPNISKTSAITFKGSSIN